MKIIVLSSSEELGRMAACHTADILRKCITSKGKARLLLSTGASQFDTLKALVREDVDWSKVEMFHLDEYIGLPEEHPASFRKYLKERFLEKVGVKKAYLIDGEHDIENSIREIGFEVSKEPIDIALIGIGENAHIAFNDPPADFDTEQPFIIVNLDETCKRQQVREGWFGSVEEVPKQAISMSVRQIMKSNCIISCVPGMVKAPAIKATLESPVTNQIPATILKTHGNYTLYLDRDSASWVDSRLIEQYK
jgi:glucosamine-6-phosphate deaminase